MERKTSQKLGRNLSKKLRGSCARFGGVRRHWK